MENTLDLLYRSLSERHRPEDIADAIMILLEDDLTKQERKLLDKAARNSLRRSVYNVSSMMQDFEPVIGAQRQVAKAQELFERARALTPAECDDPEIVRQFVQEISPEIAKAVGQNDFLKDRLNREHRRTAGLDLSKRQYNKRFRLLQRLEIKIETMIRRREEMRLTRIGKSGLAHLIPAEAFHADINTACFLAYYAARANLRSEFTVYGQQRALDEIAAMLLDRCNRHQEATNWYLIAHVFPREDVLGHLTEAEKGQLLGMWFEMLQNAATMLETVWDNNSFNKETMTVKRGDDSSTWNRVAGAWNKARDGWFSMLVAMGFSDMIEKMCPGKVLRLMAADVVAWQFSIGKGYHPDTYVWRDLPFPWEVLRGEAECPRKLVEKTCRSHNVDPDKSGWVAPRPRQQIARFKPTPELVHGVSVSSPALADYLRKNKFFSGKTGSQRTPQIFDGLLHRDTLIKHHRRLTEDEEEVE